MTIDRTEVRATGQRKAVEKKGSRIKQECRLLHLPLNHLENPQVCQSSKRTRRANLAQVTPQDEDGTNIDECGYTQPNPPVVNMLKIINHTGTTSGTQHLKFPIDVDPRGPYKHHLEVRVDTGAA